MAYNHNTRIDIRTSYSTDPRTTGDAGDPAFLQRDPNGDFIHPVRVMNGGKDREQLVKDSAQFEKDLARGVRNTALIASLGLGSMSGLAIASGGAEYVSNLVQGRGQGEALLEGASDSAVTWGVGAGLGLAVGALAKPIVKYTPTPIKKAAETLWEKRPRFDDKGGNNLKKMAGFLATDKVPETIFGIPVVASEDQYTEADLQFFKEHPEAGGYYDLGEDQ